MVHHFLPYSMDIHSLKSSTTECVLRWCCELMMRCQEWEMHWVTWHNEANVVMKTLVSLWQVTQRSWLSAQKCWNKYASVNVQCTMPPSVWEVNHLQTGQQTRYNQCLTFPVFPNLRTWTSNSLHHWRGLQCLGHCDSIPHLGGWCTQVASGTLAGVGRSPPTSGGWSC